jgi:hypothetical protein
MKKQGTDPVRLAWGMLALFASSTVHSIVESVGIKGSASLPNSLGAPLDVIDRRWRWRLPPANGLDPSGIDRRDHQYGLGGKGVD